MPCLRDIQPLCCWCASDHMLSNSGFQRRGWCHLLKHVSPHITIFVFLTSTVSNWQPPNHRAEDSKQAVMDSAPKRLALVTSLQISVSPLRMGRYLQGWVEAYSSQAPHSHGWIFPKQLSHKYAPGGPREAFDLLPSDLCMSFAQPHSSQQRQRAKLESKLQRQRSLQRRWSPALAAVRESESGHKGKKQGRGCDCCYARERCRWLWPVCGSRQRAKGNKGPPLLVSPGTTGCMVSSGHSLSG